MIVAHPFIGVCVTHLVASRWKNLDTKQQSLIWITGITAAILPDFDLALIPFFTNTSHHLFITHTPMFYLVIGLLLALILLYLEKVKKKNVLFLEKLLTILLVNVLIHILFDVVIGNIRLFWPIDFSTYNLFSIPSTNWVRNYLKSPAILTEVASIICGFISLFMIRGKQFSKAIFATFIWWFTITIIMTSVLVLKL